MEFSYKKYFIIEIATIICVVVAIFIFVNTPLKNKINQLEFEENAIYLVVRGTNSKAGWIAKKYNQTNLDATHVGIGLWGNKEFEVFHISDELSERGDNLFRENILEFITRDDLLYVSIWKIKHMGSQKFNRIVRSLSVSTQKAQHFDKQILMGNDSFYCSEYVNDILSENNINLFKKVKIQLSGFPKSFLDCDSLEYYPVDGFMKSNEIQLVFEWGKENN